MAEKLPTTNEQIEELNENLEILSSEIDEANSKKQSFIRGLFVGVGTAIGASIIAALILAIVGGIITSLQGVPFFAAIGEWLKTQGIIQ